MHTKEKWIMLKISSGRNSEENASRTDEAAVEFISPRSHLTYILIALGMFALRLTTVITRTSLGMLGVS